jgi:hypothetical protein
MNSGVFRGVVTVATAVDEDYAIKFEAFSSVNRRDYKFGSWAFTEFIGNVASSHPLCNERHIHYR